VTQKTTQKPDPDQTENIEELFEIEETSSRLNENELSEIYDTDKAFNIFPHRAEIAEVIRLYNNPDLALIVLDTNLTIMYASPKTSVLFSPFYSITRKPFFNIFRNTIEQNTMMNLIQSLRSQIEGFSWSGILKHKSQKTRTLHTRTNILPFFDQLHELAGFLVFFENITDQYYFQLRSTFNSILEASKLKDNETGKHNERVSYYSKRMAEKLYELQLYPQIDPDFIENISFLAAMHDVGKIGTPDYILQKPGKLTELEWEIMREHTINGTFILSSYPVPMAKEIALSHHEWWNGTGYPFKLESEMIPLSARIVTISDVYDALRMRRSYKNSFSHEEAVARIVAGSGTQFDPALVHIFGQIHTDFNEIWNLLQDSDIANTQERDRSKEFTGLA
jgi:putative two-component system response regulator